MDEETNVQGTETEGTETEDIIQAKTFTQEEVDAIVEKRLARERKKFSGILSGKDPRELELDERENAVKKMELQLTARTLLKENGLPEESLALLNYEDEEKMKQSVGLLNMAVNNSVRKQIDNVLRGGRPMKKAPEPEPESADLRGAFGLHG